MVLAVATFGLVAPSAAGAEEPAAPGQEAVLAPAEAAELVPVEEATAAPLAGLEFRPNSNITRAAVARMLHQIAGTPTPGAGCGGLTDVPAWARDAICWLVNNDHASGFPDKTFRPTTKITRGSVAVMLHHIAGSPAAGAGCGGLTDVPNWAHGAICWLVNNDYATGFPPTTVTRSVASPQETVAAQVNRSRTGRGLRALKVNGALNDKAQAWSAYLARIGRLAHSNLASGIPYKWRSLAENVGYGSSLSYVHLSFMRSSGHRANILGNFTHMGTGVTTAGNRVDVVHVFMRL